jgi:hypothetical protein
MLFARALSSILADIRWFETVVRLRRFYKKTLLVLRGGLLAAAGLAFFVAAVGVPLPTGGKKDRSIPFPCMDRTCGCHDAAGCKAHCCCFSGEEKLAWAAAHDVDPAPFVDDRTLASLSHENRVAHDCCAGDGVPQEGVAEGFISADAADCPHGVATCCSKKAAAPKPASLQHDRRHDSDHADGLLTIAAVRECTGLQPLWTLLDAALPPAEPVGYEFDWLPTGHVVQRDAAVTVLSYSPPTPPPRS